jgi:ubiquinone/menaquinone biosynthesis C-methylase UbiE
MPGLIFLKSSLLAISYMVESQLLGENEKTDTSKIKEKPCKQVTQVSFQDSPPEACLVCGAALPYDRKQLACRACGFCLERKEGGLLAGPGTIHDISYPDTGANLLFEIEERSFWFHHRYQIIDAVIQRHPHGGTLWDIGGGNGFQSLRLQKRGQSAAPVVLVEPGLAGCLNAKRRGVQHVIQSTLEGLGLPDARVDAIAFFDILEHLEHPDVLLRETYRSLRRGGKLYITVPAYQFLWSDEDIYAEHKRRYTRKGLVQNLEKLGFQINFASYFFQSLLLPLFLLRTLPYLLTPRKIVRTEATTGQKEHTPSPLARRILDFFLGRELRKIERGKQLDFGTSIICSATRV